MRNCCCDNCVFQGDKNCPLENALKDVDLLNEEIGNLEDKISRIETERQRE